MWNSSAGLSLESETKNFDAVNIYCVAVTIFTS